MAEIRIRFRTDSWHWAELRANGATDADFKQWGYSDAELELSRRMEPLQPGDCWRVRWYSGPVAGYAICCPTCRKVHAWTMARYCGTRRKVDCGKDQDGNTLWGEVCDHSGKGSCWNWTGSAEEGTLTASPSLFSVPELGGCGFHGFLTNGVLSG